MIIRLLGTRSSFAIVSLVALVVIAASLLASPNVLSLLPSASAQGQSGSSNADLRELAFILGGGSLDPAFSPAVTEYSVTPAIAFSGFWVLVNASASESGARVTVNGRSPVSSGNNGLF